MQISKNNINMVKIKVCGMRDKENILALNKCKPDYIGFIFYPKSKRHITNKSVINLVTPEITKIGVFVNENINTVLDICDKYKISHVQLHGYERVNYCKNLKNNGLKVIKAFSVGKEFSFKKVIPYNDHVDYYLFDTKGEGFGGTGKQFNWNILDDYHLNKPYFLSGGISPDSIDELQHFVNKAYAFDINSKFETEPGLKNIKQVNNFISFFSLKTDSQIN